VFSAASGSCRISITKFACGSQAGAAGSNPASAWRPGHHQIRAAGGQQNGSAPHVGAPMSIMERDGLTAIIATLSRAAMLALAPPASE